MTSSGLRYQWDVQSKQVLKVKGIVFIWCKELSYFLPAAAEFNDLLYTSHSGKQIRCEPSCQWNISVQCKSQHFRAVLFHSRVEVNCGRSTFLFRIAHSVGSRVWERCIACCNADLHSLQLYAGLIHFWWNYHEHVPWKSRFTFEGVRLYYFILSNNSVVSRSPKQYANTNTGTVSTTPSTRYLIDRFPEYFDATNQEDNPDSCCCWFVILAAVYT